MRALAPLALVALVACSFSLDWNSIEGPAVDGPIAGSGGLGGSGGEGGQSAGGPGGGSGAGGSSGSGTAGTGQAGSPAGSGGVGGGAGAGSGGAGAAGTDGAGAAGLSGAAGADPTSVYAAAVMADGPVGYYRFDDDPVLTQIQSQVAAPLGNVEGGQLLAVEGALFDDASKAAGFAGARVVLGNAFAFAPGSPFTFEFWVKPDAPLTSGERTVFSKYQTDSIFNGDQGFFFRANEDGLAFSFEPLGGGNIVSVTNTAPPATDTFTYVVVTSDGATAMNLYINDLEPKRVTLTLRPAGQTAPFLLGDVFNGERFRGAIDEFAVYNKELPKVRIQAHYAAGRPPPAE